MCVPLLSAPFVAQPRSTPAFRGAEFQGKTNTYIYGYRWKVSAEWVCLCVSKSVTFEADGAGCASRCRLRPASDTSWVCAIGNLSSFLLDLSTAGHIVNSGIILSVFMRFITALIESLWPCLVNLSDRVVCDLPPAVTHAVLVTFAPASAANGKLSLFFFFDLFFFLVDWSNVLLQTCFSGVWGFASVL